MTPSILSLLSRLKKKKTGKDGNWQMMLNYMFFSESEIFSLCLISARQFQIFEGRACVVFLDSLILINTVLKFVSPKNPSL